MTITKSTLPVPVSTDAPATSGAPVKSGLPKQYDPMQARWATLVK